MPAISGWLETFFVDRPLEGFGAVEVTEPDERAKRDH
jgi:hypothetical protein